MIELLAPRSMHSWVVVLANLLTAAIIAFTLEACEYFADPKAAILIAFAVLLISTESIAWRIKGVFIVYACFHFNQRVLITKI